MITTFNNIPPISPLCQTCGKEMKLSAISPGMESVIRYVCPDDHVFEYKIVD